MGVYFLKHDFGDLTSGVSYHGDIREIMLLLSSMWLTIFYYLDLCFLCVHGKKHLSPYAFWCSGRRHQLTSHIYFHHCWPRLGSVYVRFFVRSP